MPAALAAPAPPVAPTAAPPAAPPAAAPLAPETPPAVPASALPATRAPAPTFTSLVAADRPATLHQAPGTVAALVRLSESRGVSHARIALKPVELGGIEIHIARSAGGVTASMVAESPEAARALQQAAGELRRSLEAQDVTLLSLDVSTSGDERGTAGARADGDDPASPTFGRRGTRDGAPDDPDLDPIRVGVIELPDGVLVDVLA